jgi:hypothetical protein
MGKWVLFHRRSMTVMNEFIQLHILVTKNCSKNFLGVWWYLLKFLCRTSIVYMPEITNPEFSFKEPFDPQLYSSRIVKEFIVAKYQYMFVIK